MNDLFVEQMTEMERLEAEIEIAERNNYLVRGRCLAKIRDSDPNAPDHYLQRYQTFEAYCDGRWEMGVRTAYQFIAAAQFADVCAIAHIPQPLRESHIRPLFKLDNDNDRLEVWQEVLEDAGGRPRNIQAADVEVAVGRFIAKKRREYFTLEEWEELHPDLQLTIVSAGGGVASNEGLNRQENADIEWASWSWNPVTGCLHGCPYCYARDIALRVYPEEVGFGAALWPRRLLAPIDRHPEGDGAAKNIFVCSMADLFGRWVPERWIRAVIETAAASPQWNFLFLTKFPNRMAEFDFPDNAWLGTSVDLQARVANAEKSFAKIKSPVRKWLSIEPMLEPLKFKHLNLFDWIVVGGASPSRASPDTPATPAWNVPFDWLTDIQRQARAAGCAVFQKTNSGIGGMTRLREYPGTEQLHPKAPPVFDYLGSKTA